jgi:uncharacterized iron-regulated protein
MLEARAVQKLPLVLVLGVIAGCGSTKGSVSTEPDAAAVEQAEPRGFGPWEATVATDHPLVGTAWLVAEGRALTREELEQRAAAARLVLLGETHDHPDHHRLQGELIVSLLEPAPGPAVAYEMLDPAMQPQIDEFVAAGSRDVDGFAELVAWADSGWPAWTLYRAAFAPVIEAQLPILAAQFPRAQSRRFMSEGLAMLDPALVARFELDQPLPSELLEPALDEMLASHCGMGSRDQFAPMVEIQRIRDAVMADALLRGADARRRAVLVAGTGHTRLTGVPRLLQLAGESRSAILSVGFVAVDPERLDPREYGAEFDVIVLTPGVEREDPCKGM